MIRELLIYSLAPVAVLLTWTYQRLADRGRARWREDIRAALAIWWVQDHYRGSVAVQCDVETLPPAADSSGSESTAGPNDRADSYRQTATARTDPATGVPGRSPVAGHNVPTPALPYAAVGTDPAAESSTPELGRGPKQPDTVVAPDHGGVRPPTPHPREIHEGHEGAVVPEATAPARAA